MARILILEDDQNICEILQFYLRQKPEYELHFARSAEEAFDLVDQHAFYIMLLDIMLPGINGIEFCRAVRSRTDCPIIFTSCLNDGSTIIEALETGGDDYLVKPFEPSVLIAHIEAKLRRPGTNRDHGGEVLRVDGLELDRRLQSVTKNGKPVQLSQTEYNLLAFFMEHRGVYISFDDAFRAIWNAPSLGNYRALFVHISNLRKKIEDDPASPTLLKTCRRTGYVFGGE